MEISQTYYKTAAADAVIAKLKENKFNVSSEPTVGNGFHGTRVTVKAQGWKRTDEAYLIMNKD